MVGVVCLTAALLGAPAATETGWRSKEVSGVMAEGETLESLVGDLAVRTRTPIHLVFEGDAPVIRDIDNDSKTTLGRIYDRIAEQVPGIKAVATERGVIWICPIRKLVRRPLEAKFESDEFTGKLDALMIECFFRGVRGLGHIVFDPSHDPQLMKVDVQGVGRRTSLDVAVVGAEQNEVCLRLRLDMNPPREGDDANAVPLPDIYYRLIPLRNE